jgi:hypothetical protein
VEFRFVLEVVEIEWLAWGEDDDLFGEVAIGGVV